MTTQEFIDKWNGKGLDFDSYYGFQCMDLAEEYNKDVVQAPKLGGNAVDVWTHYPTDFYDKIPNSPTGVPQKGDIVIWGQGVGQFGHIAVFESGDTNNFVSFDQNWPLGSICHAQNHNYNGVLGWLHPKKTSEPMAIITQADLDMIRVDRDSNYNNWQEQLAKDVADLKQVAELQNSLSASQSELNALKTQLNEKDKEIANLKIQLANCHSQPSKEIIKEVPVEKIVYKEKIIDATGFKKLSFSKKLSLLFS